MNTLRATLLGWWLLAGGCLGRTIPLPPPGATIQSVLECPVATCPMGGVIVRLGGTNAQGNARIFVEDIDVPPEMMGGQVLGASARATAAGVWSITLEPQRDRAGMVRAVQRGHRLEVIQANEDGDTSSPTTVTVPRM